MLSVVSSNPTVLPDALWCDLGYCSRTAIVIDPPCLQRVGQGSTTTSAAAAPSAPRPTPTPKVHLADDFDAMMSQTRRNDEADKDAAA